MAFVRYKLCHHHPTTIITTITTEPQQQQQLTTTTTTSTTTTTTTITTTITQYHNNNYHYYHHYYFYYYNCNYNNNFYKSIIFTSTTYLLPKPSNTGAIWSLIILSYNGCILLIETLSILFSLRLRTLSIPTIESWYSCSMIEAMGYEYIIELLLLLW
jgi:hypothetical protein